MSDSPVFAIILLILFLCRKSLEELNYFDKRNNADCKTD